MKETDNPPVGFWFGFFGGEGAGFWLAEFFFLLAWGFLVGWLGGFVCLVDFVAVSLSWSFFK